MKNLIQRIWWACLLIVLSSMLAVAANRYAVNSSDWNKTSTWSATSGGSSGASVPVAGDNVYIAEASFYTVIIPSGYAAACANLQIGTAGTSTNGYVSFSAASSSLTVSGNVDLYQPGDGWTREIDVWGGTLNVNGDLNMNVGANSTISTRVTKVKVSTGTVTVAGNLVFNNVAGGSALQNQLDLSVNTATFNLGGSFTITNNIGTLTPGTSSTFNFNGTSAQTIPVGVSSVVYNNLNVNNTNASGATLSAAISATNVTGNIAVQSGKFSNGGFAIVGNAAKSFTVSNAATFTLTGTSGMVTGFGTKTFGATSTVDYAGSDQTVSGESYGHFIIGGSGTKTAAGNLTIAGNLTVSVGTLDLSTFTANRSASGGTLSVSNGATLKIGSTNSFPSNYTTHTLGATSTVEYGGSAQTVTNEAYGHLTLSGTDTKTMPGSNMTLSGNFTMSGTVSATAGQQLLVWGNFTIGTGCTFNASSYTHTLKADFSNSGTFTAATSTIILNGNTSQNITGSATSIFNNLTLNNAAGITLGANATLNGTLTLTSGNITTSSWFVSIVSTGTVTRTSGHIVGNLRKIIPTGAASKTFEIGTGADYAPVGVVFGNVTVNGNLTATTSVGDHANIVSSSIDPAKTVNRTWTLTNGGITFDNYSATFTFVASDVDAGVNTNNVIVGKYSGSWTYPTVGTKTTTTTQITGVTSFSDFQIGESGGLPVQLSSFTAHAAVGALGMTLEWTTISETNNYGFEVERKGLAQSDFTLLPGSFVPGHGTTLQPQHYSFTDAAAGDGVRFYRLRQVDLDGSIHYSEPIRVDLVTGVEEHSIPSEFALEQNYPNPFNPTTVIKYSLPASAHVSLKLYNLVGQEVLTLLDERQEAGVKSVTLNASGLPSGMYLYKLHAGDFVSTKRLVLLK